MKHRSFALGLVVVAGGMLLGRATGLLREMTLARVFGLSRAADLAMFAMTLPDLLTGLLIGGAIGAVLVPEYHRRAQDAGDTEGRRLVGQTLVTMFGVSCLLAMALAVAAPLWVRVLAPGFEGADRSNAIDMGRIALLAFPLSALSAVVMAFLQIQQRLRTVTLGTAVFNLGAVGVILALATPQTASIAAWAVVVGAAARALLQIVAAGRGAGFQGAFAGWNRFDQLSRPLVARYLQALGGIGILILLPMIARAFASHVPGEAAAVSYAIKLAEVPTGLCAAVLSLLVFPRLSKAVQAGRDEEAARLLTRTGQVALAVLVPSVLLASWLAGPIVAMVFQHGRLTPESARLVAQLSQITLLGVPAAVLTNLAMIGFHARRDTKTPFRWGLLVLALAVPLCWLASQEWGVRGVVVTIAALQLVNGGGLLLWLRARHAQPAVLDATPCPARAA